MPTPTQLLAATTAFFTALSSNTPPLQLLSHFSTTHPAQIQHLPRQCPNPQASLLSGPNAIRSYFDLLATHWVRVSTVLHSPHVLPGDEHKVRVKATIGWMWKRSRRTWTEECEATLEFDEGCRIRGLVIKTEGDPRTCVMQAVDGGEQAQVMYQCAGRNCYPTATGAYERASGATSAYERCLGIGMVTNAQL